MSTSPTTTTNNNININNSTYRLCHCERWEHCDSLRKLFVKHKDVHYGGDVIQTQINNNLPESDVKGRKWSKGVLKNLGIEESSISFKNNVARISIARHHWAHESIRYFFGDNMNARLSFFPSTPVDMRKVNQLAHGIDKEYCFKDGKGKKVYLLVPNLPEESVILYAQSTYNWTPIIVSLAPGTLPTSLSSSFVTPLLYNTITLPHFISYLFRWH